jgi:hypothetical protein
LPVDTGIIAIFVRVRKRLRTKSAKRRQQPSGAGKPTRLRRWVLPCPERTPVQKKTSAEHALVVPQTEGLPIRRTKTIG